MSQIKQTAEELYHQLMMLAGGLQPSARPRYAMCAESSAQSIKPFIPFDAVMAAIHSLDPGELEEAAVAVAKAFGFAPDNAATFSPVDDAVGAVVVAYTCESYSVDRETLETIGTPFDRVDYLLVVLDKHEATISSASARQGLDATAFLTWAALCRDAFRRAGGEKIRWLTSVGRRQDAELQDDDWKNIQAGWPAAYAVLVRVRESAQVAKTPSAPKLATVDARAEAVPKNSELAAFEISMSPPLDPRKLRTMNDQSFPVGRIIGDLHAVRPAGVPSMSEASEKAKLNETDARAAKYIRRNPGCKGDAVASHICVTPEHFRSRIFPKLREHGFSNDNGYRPPKRVRKS